MTRCKEQHCGPKIIGMIPARYASTRFPGKILAPIAGKTLIQRTYENAKRCTLLHKLIVATDDMRIYSHVKDFGGEVVMTSPTCATGSDRLVEALKNNLQFNDASIIVNIQGDEPCLDPEVIHKVTEALLADPIAVMSTAVVKIDNAEDAANPSVVKCVMDKQNNALYFTRALLPAGHTLKMRPGINYYRHMGVYCFRKHFLMQYADLPPSPLQLAEDLEQLKILEHGFRIKVAIVDDFSIGVDTPEDIKKVEQWLCKQNIFSSQAAYALPLERD
jgi:3-deoxy-manno-octulosonate cytidylyltransferase (CMP-KDO synthetase)